MVEATEKQTEKDSIFKWNIKKGVALLDVWIYE